MIDLQQRNVQVLRGFLAELWEQDRDVAQHLLDSAIDHPVLQAFLPILQSAMGLDERGVDRMKLVLRAGHAPPWTYRYIALGRATDLLAGSILKDLLLLIADQPGGFDVALAASIVTFARRPEISAPQVWSEQARVLFARAPNPRTVLERFIKRFRPMSWSGSRAAIIEENARLLDMLEDHAATASLHRGRECSLLLPSSGIGFLLHRGALFLSLRRAPHEHVPAL